MTDEVTRIRLFIGAEPVKATNAFLTTLRRNGEPFTRQVSTFVEEWTVRTIISGPGLAVKHLRHRPIATYLYVESNPPTNRRRNVFLSGIVDLTNDLEAVKDFFERRAAATGWPIPAPGAQRTLISFRPLYLRAEGFRTDRYDGREPPVVLRDFPPVD
ncbi:MAG: hypothetical protein U0556_19065 [Dehalococcoidia bacterium]